MFAFIATIAQAGNTIIDKIALTRQRMELRIFIPILFILLFLLTAVLFPWLGWISPLILTAKYQMLFWAMIAVAIIWNIFYYRAVQAEKVHEFELIVMGQPLVTILLASVFLANERNWPVVIVSIIAAATLLMAYVRREHFEFSRELWGLVVAVILMSVELILIDLLLAVFSPVALYAVRTGIVAIVFLLWYRPHLKLVANHHYSLILASAALGVTQMVAKFYGFSQFGVIYTSLILILAPILVYLASAIILHEKIKVRTIIASIIILACVVFATVFRN